MTIDNCEIKETNYYEESPNTRPLNAQIIDALYDQSENDQQDFIEQSVIIYHNKSGYSNSKIVSPSFPFNAINLRYYLENKKLILYINLNDDKDYFFDLVI